MTMTPEKAKALREPFPPSAVGKLPKPYRADSQRDNCRECGGYHGLPAVHLDYVGHAATTDRLLAVDPSWSWEPLSFDEQGLPALDRKGNLWIRLTVCGVTRIGVGDGKSAKECIGDAIRNAAMRFGVALDLWAKEDLHEIHTAQNEPEPVKAAPTPPPPDPDVTREREDDDLLDSLEAQVAAPMTAKTRGGMFAEFARVGIPEDKQLAGINQITGKAYTSRGDLTEADAKRVIADLKQRPSAVKA